MSNQFEFLRVTRNNLLGLTRDLTLEQLNQIPGPFRNNLVWNMGHLVVTQQLLCYRFSGLPCLVEDALIDKYRKGSRPEGKGKVEAAEIDRIRELLMSTVDATEKDYSAGLFRSYKSYTTSYNAELNSIEDALVFNNIHEGMHLGYCLAMKKFVL